MHRLSQLSAVIAIMLAPMAASAQFAYTPPPMQRDSSSPYFLSVSQAFSHESNVFRDPDATKVPDYISSTGVRFGIDQPISRQRIGADVIVRYNKYHNQTQLDNTGYGINLRGEFETAGNISGDVRYSRSQQLASGEDARSTARVTSRNMLTSDEFGLRVQYGGRAKWTVEGQGTYRNQSYGASQFAAQEQNEAGLGATLRYRPSDLVSFGVGLRGTHGEVPNYVPVGGAALGDSYDRTDIDFTARYQLSGLTTLNGRVSATHSKHDVATERNYNGLTGEVGATYQYSGKLTFNANASRETNDTSNLYQTTLGTGTVGTTRLQDTRLVHSLRLQAAYAATSKISATAALRYSQRNLRDAVIVDPLGNAIGTASGTDKTTGIALGVSYAISRAWSAACSIGHDRRTTDLVGANVTYPYTSNTYSCSASLALR